MSENFYTANFARNIFSGGITWIHNHNIYIYVYISMYQVFYAFFTSASGDGVRPKKPHETHNLCSVTINIENFHFLTEFSFIYE